MASEFECKWRPTVVAEIVAARDLRSLMTPAVLNAHAAVVQLDRDLRSPRFCVFVSATYDPRRMCNQLWMQATTLYWAIAKIEALGEIGVSYTVVDFAE